MAIDRSKLAKRLRDLPDDRLKRMPEDILKMSDEDLDRYFERQRIQKEYFSKFGEQVPGSILFGAEANIYITEVLAKQALETGKPISEDQWSEFMPETKPGETIW